MVEDETWQFANWGRFIIKCLHYNYESVYGCLYRNDGPEVDMDEYEIVKRGIESIGIVVAWLGYLHNGVSVNDVHFSRLI